MTLRPLITPRHPSTQRTGVCSSIVRLQLFLQYFHRLLHTATVLCYVVDVDSAVFVDARIPQTCASDTAATTAVMTTTALLHWALKSIIKLCLF